MTHGNKNHNDKKNRKKGGECRKCKFGYYSLVKNKSPCKLCAAGKFSPDDRDTECAERMCGIASGEDMVPVVCPTVREGEEFMFFSEKDAATSADAAAHKGERQREKEGQTAWRQTIRR